MLDFNLWKKLVECHFWIIALCVAANWTDPKVDHNCLERFEMWCYRRIEVISWTDRLNSKEGLQRMTENKNNLNTIKQKKPNWTRQQFTTLSQKNVHNFFLDIYVTISTEYFCTFQPTRDHCQGVSSKQFRITLRLYVFNMVWKCQLFKNINISCMNVV